MKITILPRWQLGISALLLLLLLAPDVLRAQTPPDQAPGSRSVTLSTSAPRSVQHHRLKSEVLFPVGDSYLDLDFQDNRVNLHRFLEQLAEISADTTYIITGIEVAGSCSPEGGWARNVQLAGERATSLHDYLVVYGKIPASSIKIVNLSENWPGLKVLIEASTMPRKKVILSLMERYGDNYAALKNAVIRDQDGKTWDWMYTHFFPQLRKGAGETCDITLSYDLAAAATPHPSPAVPATGGEVFSTTSTAVVSPSTVVRKPLFALKTNLLFDAASLLNIEAEVPLGKRFSIAGELIAPWWLWENQQHCVQVMSGNLEGRYWFGNRDKTRRGTPRPVLTGWFAGLYAGGGYYDLEWDRTGYQGEFFIAAGVSGGYAHTINKRGNLRMEYSLGIGYMQTNYRKYEAKLATDNQWHLYRQESGTYRWFGPTRLKISLVWLLHSTKKGGVR